MPSSARSGAAFVRVEPPTVGAGVAPLGAKAPSAGAGVAPLGPEPPRARAGGAQVGAEASGLPRSTSGVSFVSAAGLSSPSFDVSRLDVAQRRVVAPDGRFCDDARIRVWLEQSSEARRGSSGVLAFEAEDLQFDPLATDRALREPRASDGSASSLCDPITCESFIRPVTASDGRTYALATLRELYRRDFRSPFSREALETIVHRNRVVEAKIEKRRRDAANEPQPSRTPRTLALESAYDGGEIAIDLASFLGPPAVMVPTSQLHSHGRMFFLLDRPLGPDASSPFMCAPKTCGCVMGALAGLVTCIGTGTGAGPCCGLPAGGACAAAVLGGGVATLACCCVGRRLGTHGMAAPFELGAFTHPPTQAISRD